MKDKELRQDSVKSIVSTRTRLRNEGTGTTGVPVETPVSTRTRLRNEGLNLDTSSPEVSYSPYGRREDGVNGLKREEVS